MTEGEQARPDPVSAAATDLAEVATDLVGVRKHETSLSATREDLDRQIAALMARRDDVDRQIASDRTHESTDERRMEHDMDVVRRGLGTGAPADGGEGCLPPPPAPARRYEFFVNGQAYETEQATMTGLQIKAMVVGWVVGQSLSEEGVGAAPDRLVGDLDVIDFGAALGPVHFFSVPSASFG